MNHPPILLGTSSFTASGWEGAFYPKGMRSADYLAFYAEHFHPVEVDSTFYGCPTARTVNNCRARFDSFLRSSSVYSGYVRCLRSVRALDNFEFNGVPFVQSSVSFTYDC